jgi:hypothetical protein
MHRPDPHRVGWYFVANQDYNKYILVSSFLFSVFWLVDVYRQIYENKVLDLCISFGQPVLFPWLALLILSHIICL